jgi:ribosomal protein S18 acetylase RimI-like enzyme
MNASGSGTTLRELLSAELSGAAQLLGRGMRDNPNNVRAFGPDAERRCRALTRFFAPVLRGARRRGSVLGAFRDDSLVGVSVAAPPGLCQPKAAEKLSVFPSVFFGNSIGVPLRVLRWIGEWSRRDPTEAHWHLGPVAVDAHLQRRGIGGTLMTDFCARMDRAGSLSYLETDKGENVSFYERFGFEVIAESEVLGVSNWFMSRTPRPRASSTSGEL